MSAGGYDLEEIRRRADMVEIVSAHVALRKSGRRLSGLCPFHKERSASFTLDPETGLWHCFGCKAGGDLFRFVEMVEKVTFGEAVELLARRLGVQPRRPAEAAQQRQRERLIALHEQAARFFQSRLRGQPGAEARQYLASRGLSQKVIEDFRIGHAPASWDALLKAMGEQGYSAEEVARAGLAVAGDRPGDGAPTGGARHWDRFRDRIIFPIWDASGRVVAFGGRALREDQQPKYLNSPETVIFQKGRTLYAFDRARRAMGEAGRAIVVEGYLDAIACQEAGLAETVATMGTALTSEHVEILRRRVQKLVLAFDSDSAGLAAALRGRKLFQQAGLSVVVVSLPEKADPDRVLRDQGADRLRELVERAVPMVEWELQRVLASAAPGAEGKRPEVLQQAVAALARWPAGVEREYYVRWLAQQWGADGPGAPGALESAIRAELAGYETRRPASGRRSESARAQGASPPGRISQAAPVGRVERALLSAFLQQGELAQRYSSELEAGDFAIEEQRSLFESISRLVGTGSSVTPQAVLDEIPSEARGLLAELSVQPQGDRVEEDVRRGVQRLLENRLRRQEGALRERLDRAQSAREREAILRELTVCRRRRSELAGRRWIGEA